MVVISGNGFGFLGFWVFGYPIDFLNILVAYSGFGGTCGIITATAVSCNEYTSLRLYGECVTLFSLVFFMTFWCS